MIIQHKAYDDEVTDKLRCICLEYISGYEGSHTKVKVRCLVCGGIFERRYDNLIMRAKDGCALCPICLEQKQKAKREQEEKAKRDAWINAERRKMEREADLISRVTEKRLASHVCKNCGISYCIAMTGYDSDKYCSTKCMKRWAMRVKNDRRIKRMQNRDHDNDITLEKLYMRDGGICYLCGAKCDWTDQDADGNAQNNYPSIDHVIPIAKGGKHKWDNVRLAHRGCNILKRDKV